MSLPAWLSNHLQQLEKQGRIGGTATLLYGSAAKKDELLGILGKQETAPVEPYPEARLLWFGNLEPEQRQAHGVLSEITDPQLGPEESSTSTPLSSRSWRPYPPESSKWR